MTEVMEPEILVKDPDQSLPENPIGKPGRFISLKAIQLEVAKSNLYHQAQQDMLKENWVKVLPKEEK